MHYKAYDFNQEKRDATKILTSVFRDVNEVEDSELRDAFRRASSARRRAFEKMISIADAARKSGLTQNQIEMDLRNNGISKADAKALASGDVSKWEMSDTTLKKSVKKADLLFGESVGKQYERRWGLIQGLLEKENEI